MQYHKLVCTLHEDYSNTTMAFIWDLMFQFSCAILVSAVCIIWNHRYPSWIRWRSSFRRSSDAGMRMRLSVVFIGWISSIVTMRLLLSLPLSDVSRGHVREHHINIVQPRHRNNKILEFITLHRARCGAVYCNRSCLFECGWVCGSVTTITRNCVHRSSPNWVCSSG